jgi:hypothetical protein
MSPEVHSELRATRTGEPVADKAQYLQVLGSLLHMAPCTLPDIALPVGALAPCALLCAHGGYGREKDHIWEVKAFTEVLVRHVMILSWHD